MFEKLLAESLVSHKLPTHGSEFQDKETTEDRGITQRNHSRAPGRRENNSWARGDCRPKRPGILVWGAQGLRAFKNKLFLFLNMCFPLGMKLNLWRWCWMHLREQPGSYKARQVPGNPATHPGFLVSPWGSLRQLGQTCAFLQGKANMWPRLLSEDLAEPQQLPPDSTSYRKAKGLPVCKYCWDSFASPAKPFPLSPRALVNSSSAFQFPGEGTCYGLNEEWT